MTCVQIHRTRYKFHHLSQATTSSKHLYRPESTSSATGIFILSQCSSQPPSPHWSLVPRSSLLRAAQWSNVSRPLTRSPSVRNHVPIDPYRLISDEACHVAYNAQGLGNSAEEFKKVPWGSPDSAGICTVTIIPDGLSCGIPVATTGAGTYQFAGEQRSRSY